MNQSLRQNIAVKFLLTDNINYKLSRNALVLEYRKYRMRMSEFIDVVSKLEINCENENNKLDTSQTRCISDITKTFANSNKDNRFENYIHAINILSNFVNGQTINSKEPLSKKELKVMKIMGGYLFMKASECIDELNNRI